METKNIIKGLQTLMPYYDNPDGYHTGADHDVIYALETKRPLSKNDLEIMITLGWHQENNDRDYNKDFTAADYRVNETWHCYI